MRPRNKLLSYREAVGPIVDVYRSPNGSAGCCLHVLTDDANHGCGQFVLHYALERGHRACVRAALLLARCSPTQAAKATREAHRVLAKGCQ